MTEKKRKLERHKWVNDRNGKHCKKCFSSIGTRAGTIKYVERDEFGVLNAVNWYPRCFPELPNSNLQSGKAVKG